MLYMYIFVMRKKITYFGQFINLKKNEFRDTIGQN